MLKTGFLSLNDWLAEESAKGDKLIDNEKRDYYGCVMMEANIDNWEDYHLAGIDEEDIYIKPYDESYGLEEQPHITVLYGLHEDEVDEEVYPEIIKQNMKPLTVLINEIDIFEGDEYDVVKYNVPISDQLQEYRDLFMRFPNTQTFPEFKPHMTIAYVKPGEGKKYKRKLREPFEVTFDKGVYSYHSDPLNPDDYSRKVVKLEDDSLEELKETYPNLDFRLKPSEKFKNSYLASVYEGEKYLGGLRGPCSYDKAIKWFKIIANNES